MSIAQTYPDMMEQQKLVITGVTSGLGFAMTEQFIKDGHRVAGCGRNRSVIDQLNTKYAAKGNIFAVVDLTSADAVKTFAENVLKKLGTLNFLVNNAGYLCKPVNLWKLEIEEFSKVTDINLKGTFHMMHEFVPAMIKQGSGVIVNFSSLWGREGSAKQASYCCTKFGVEGLSKALALELPAPLTCVPLDPGVVNTPMLVTATDMQVADHCRTPATWAETACPFILSIHHGQNGQSVTAP